MYRRQYLVRAGGAASLGAVAGCLDAFGDDESEDAPDSASSAERGVDRDISRAAGQLNRAAASLQTLEDGAEDPASISFDSETPRAHLTDAGDHLDSAAAADATDDRLADVAELRAYREALAALVDVAATLAADDLEGALESTQTAIDEGELDRARSALVDRRETLGEATDRLESARETLADLDRDRLADLDAVPVADVEAGVADLDGALAALDALAAGYERLVEGRSLLEAGQNALDDGDLEQAGQAFADGSAAFADASDTFESEPEAAPSGLDARFETGTCRSTTLEDAAAALEESVAAAEDRDPGAAADHRADAEDLLVDAAACGD